MSLSYTQRDALRRVQKGTVTWSERFGVSGLRTISTLYALEKRGLVEISLEDVNPRGRIPRYRVVLTAEGKAVLE